MQKSGWDCLGCFWGGVGKVLGAEAPRVRGLPGASWWVLRSPGGRGGVASPRTAPCAASAPRGGPAPRRHGNSRGGRASARLACLGLRRSRGGWGGLSPGRHRCRCRRCRRCRRGKAESGAGAGPGRERSHRALGPRPGRGQGEGRGGAGAVGEGSRGCREQRERGGRQGFTPLRLPGCAFAPVVRGPAGPGSLSPLSAPPPALTAGVGSPRACGGLPAGRAGA